MNTTNDIERGYCACGCGGKTTVANRNNRRANQVKGEPVRFIKGHNTKQLAWSNHRNWSGGRNVDQSGYMVVTVPKDHALVSMARRTGGTSYGIAEHRLVVAEALGRPLTSAEFVHHIDGNKQRNVLENLVIVNGGVAHARIHRFQKELSAEWDTLRKLLRLGRRRAYNGPVPTVGALPIPKELT